MSNAIASTHSMFTVLLARWDTAPGLPEATPPQASGHMHEARHVMKAAMQVYVPWMQPQDVALYDSLLQAPDADALSAQFFRCFDLMVRTRGTAIAVLRMHELYRLLQAHITR